jgi:predicted GNAT family N-acyltransferase
MEIQFLADRPEFIPLISNWYYSEWGRLMKDQSEQKIHDRISGMLNRDKIPLHIIAVESDELLGVAQLKIREMDIYPDKEHWLGGVYVSPAARGLGVGSLLVTRALELAKQLKVKTLYLQTENLSGGLYASLGFRPLEQAHYNGVDVLVMEHSL